jgi:hypothetical protein
MGFTCLWVFVFCYEFGVAVQVFFLAFPVVWECVVVIHDFHRLKTYYDINFINVY